MEEEVPDILRLVLSEGAPSRDRAAATRARVAPAARVNLDLPAREPMREPPRLGRGRGRSFSIPTWLSNPCGRHRQGRSRRGFRRRTAQWSISPRWWKRNCDMASRPSLPGKNASRSPKRSTAFSGKTSATPSLPSTARPPAPVPPMPPSAAERRRAPRRWSPHQPVRLPDRRDSPRAWRPCGHPPHRRLRRLRHRGAGSLGSDAVAVSAKPGEGADDPDRTISGCSAIPMGAGGPRESRTGSR